MPAVVLLLLLLLQSSACAAAAQGSREEPHQPLLAVLAADATSSATPPATAPAAAAPPPPAQTTLDQPHSLPLDDNTSRSCGRSGWEQTAVAAAADAATPPLLRSPLSAPLPQCSLQAEHGLAAHAAIQRWLDGYFHSSASELSSSRLQQAAAAAAAGSAGLMPATEARELAAAGMGSSVGAGGDGRAAGMGRAAAPAHASSCDAACRRAQAKQVLLALPASRRALIGGAGRQWQQQAQQLVWRPFPEDRRRWAAVAAEGRRSSSTTTTDSTCRLILEPGEPPPPKDFLLVAAVGDNSSALNRWMSTPGSAAFDLVVLHYGGGGSANGGTAARDFSCPHCRAVLHGAGPKWRLVWQLTQHPAWPGLIAGKAALMVPDDDLFLDTCALNRAFEIFAAYGLLLAQPSLCPTPHRATWWPHLQQLQQQHGNGSSGDGAGGGSTSSSSSSSSSVLRFTTMVEVMAPMFEADFFRGLVAPTLHNAWSGWGLDFVWPFLLHYPRDRIAVIDEVCMVHPHMAEGKRGAGSIYAAVRRSAPWDAREEEARRAHEYGYYPSAMPPLGLPHRATEVLGWVLDAPPPPQQQQQRGGSLAPALQQLQPGGSWPLPPPLSAQLQLAAVGLLATLALAAALAQGWWVRQWRSVGSPRRRTLPTSCEEALPH